MKFLLSVSVVFAMAVAGPIQPGFVITSPGIVDIEPTAFGPAIVEQSPISEDPVLAEQPEHETINVRPTVFRLEPISINPASVEKSHDTKTQVITDANGTPIVYIILNVVHGNGNIVTTPIHIGQSTPVNIVEYTLDIGDGNIITKSIERGESTHASTVLSDPTPDLIDDSVPTPIQNFEQVPIAGDPVAIGASILPSLAMVLPEILN